MTYRIAILLSGNGSNAINLFHKQAWLKQVLRPYHIMPHIALAISNEPSARGVERCKEVGLCCEIVAHRDFDSREAFDMAICERLRDYRIDIVVLAGFMRILGEAFTSAFCAINIHPSLLPLYKGARALERSFVGEEAYGGVSVHWVDDKLDSGEILLQEKLAKIQGEGIEDFARRIHALEHRIYPLALVKALLITRYGKEFMRNNRLETLEALEALEHGT